MNEIMTHVGPAVTGMIGAFFFAVGVLALLFLARWLGRAVWASGYWVYEIDLEDGSLWYIGSCRNVEIRMRRHESFQRRLPDGHPRKWWWDIDPIVQANHYPNRATWYHSKDVAESIERQRVRQKNPPGNIIKYKGVSVRDV